jgi:3-hydroxybutyrate dehydrogenase
MAKGSHERFKRSILEGPRPRRLSPDRYEDAAVSPHTRAALITGSTSGIGLAIAEKFAEAGYAVVITGFGNAQAILTLREALTSRYGVPVSYIAADAAQPAEIRDMMESAAREIGTLDILVNNVGMQHVATLDEFPDEKWDQLLAVNLSAAFHATKAALPGMKQKGWGRIINIASAHGLVASVGKAAYVASKHGLIGLTKVTALEAARFGVTVNAICPGWVRTALAEKQVHDRAARCGRPVSEEEVHMLGEKQPLAAFTTPAQVADLALYLCSSSAATITGAALSIDGGWVAQ